MCKKFLLLALAALSVLPAASQKMNRHEVSLSYGYAPAFNWIDSYGILAEQFDKPVSEVGLGGRVEHDWQIANTEMWGAATMGYNFRLLKNFSIGVQAVYATNKQHVTETSVSINNRYWAVMPEVKWTWMRLGIVSLYSRAGVGVVFTKAEVRLLNEIVNGENPWRPSTGVTESGLEVTLQDIYKMDGTRTQFAFQLSPLGIEVGGRLAAYAEGGLGVSGALVVGVRYQF